MLPRGSTVAFVMLLLATLAFAADLPCGDCPTRLVVPAGTDPDGLVREVVRVDHGAWRGDWLVRSTADGTVSVQRIADEPDSQVVVTDDTVRLTRPATDEERSRETVRVLGLSPLRLLEHTEKGWHGYDQEDLSYSWKALGLQGRHALTVCGRDEALRVDSRTVPRVAPGGAWAPLGTCAATFDAASDTVWGPATTAEDAGLKAVMVSDHELWVELADDRFVAEADSWVGADHLELWTPVQAVDGCAPGSATQWGITLDGTVHHGKGPKGVPPTVEVEGRRLRIVLSAPAWWLGLHYSDSDGEGQERLVGTGRVAGTRGASLARVQPAEDLVRCTLDDGAWQARPRVGSLRATLPEPHSPPLPVCEDCQRVDAGTDAAGRTLTVLQQECGPPDQLEVSRDGVVHYRVALPDVTCGYNHWQTTTEAGPNRWANHSSDGSFVSGGVDRTLQLSPLRPLRHARHSHDMAAGWMSDVVSTHAVLGATVRRTMDCGQDDVVGVDGRGLARVTVDAAWGVPLGRCATAFDATKPAWGAASTAADAALRAVLVGPAELWVEVDDDVVDAEGDSWVATDHLELWAAPPVPGDHCDPALQWSIGLDGRVHAGSGSPTVAPRVLERAVRGQTTALRIALPWPPSDLGLVFSDADGEGQEVLVGTHHVRGLRWQLAPVDERGRTVCRDEGGQLVPGWLGGSSELTRPRPP